MDTQKQSGSLPGMRTFAKDLESKRAVSQSVSGKTAKSEPSQPKAVVPPVVEESDNHEYRSPRWRVEKTVTPKKDLPEPEKTLLPITTPKSAGDTDIIVENEDAESATIIRDTKKDRFKLAPAIFSSLKDWYSELKRKQAIKKIPKYTVPEATRRKGVIQKATSKTGKGMSFDTTSIQERIRQRQDRALPKVPLTIWTANTEPGFTLLEASEKKVTPITNVQIQPRKSTLTAPKPPVKPTPTPAVVTPEKKPLTILPKPSPAVAVSVTQKSIPAAPKPAPEFTVPEYVEPLIEPTPEVSTIVTRAVTEEPEVAPVKISGASKLQPQSIKEWLFTIDINAIALGLTVVVVSLIAVTGAGYLWFNNQVEPLSLTTEPNYESILDAPLQPIIPSQLSREELYRSIISNYTESVYPVLQLIVVTTNSGQAMLSPTSVLSTLGIKIDGGFARSISHIYFGSINKTEPFIVLSLRDTTTVQGGMFAWEDSLYLDFAPLFSGSGRNVADSSGAQYIDATIADTDVRVLKGTQGEDLLLYGIVNRDTVIITNSRDNFSTLSALLP